MPPLFTSMNGYWVVVKMSPATITSAVRKWTRLSPSVLAFGRWKSSIASPLWNLRRAILQIRVRRDR